VSASLQFTSSINSTEQLRVLLSQLTSGPVTALLTSDSSAIQSELGALVSKDNDWKTRAKFYAGWL